MNIRRQLILDKHLNGVDYNNGHELNSAVIAAMEEYKDEVINKNEHLHIVVDSQFTEPKEVFEITRLPDLPELWIDPNEPIINYKKHYQTCLKNRKSL